MVPKFFIIEKNWTEVISNSASNVISFGIHTVSCSIFKIGIESGELKNGNYQTYAEVLLGIIHHHIFMVNMELIEFNQEKADQILDIFFNGVKSEKWNLFYYF